MDRPKCVAQKKTSINAALVHTRSINTNEAAEIQARNELDESKTFIVMYKCVARKKTINAVLVSYSFYKH